MLFQCFLNIIILLSSFNLLVSGFPSGAPAEACESLSPERGHLATSQPVEYAPFEVIQHSYVYNPGDKISVEIKQLEPKTNFKGFLVQALDLRTNEYIGEFVTGEGMQAMKECSAVTHSNAKPKKSAQLLWQAPYDKSGEVKFRATIVIKKDTYFANIQAKTYAVEYVLQPQEYSSNAPQHQQPQQYSANQPPSYGPQQTHIQPYNQPQSNQIQPYSQQPPMAYPPQQAQIHSYSQPQTQTQAYHQHPTHIQPYPQPQSQSYAQPHHMTIADHLAQYAPPNNHQSTQYAPQNDHHSTPPYPPSESPQNYNNNYSPQHYSPPPQSYPLQYQPQSQTYFIKEPPKHYLPAQNYDGPPQK